MKRMLRLRKKNILKADKGFSLIEVLVSMAILALITIPIMSSFITSMRLNMRARKEENATTIASDIIENLKTGTMSELVSEYNISLSDDPLESMHGVLTFEKRNVEGNNGEKFTVSGKLDPRPYITGTSYFYNTNNANDINSYQEKALFNVYSDNSIVLRDCIFKYDQTARYSMASEGLTDEDLIERTTRIKVSVDTNGAEYIQTVTVDVAYQATESVVNGEGETKTEYYSYVPVNQYKYTNKSIVNEGGMLKGIKPVYVVYAPFNIKNVAYSEELNSYCPSPYSEKIEIEYDYPYGVAAVTSMENASIYFIGQTASSGGRTIQISPANMNFTVGASNAYYRNNIVLSNYNGGKYTATGNSTVNIGCTASDWDPAYKKLKVSLFANVPGWNNNSSLLQDRRVPEGETEYMDLYEITLSVESESGSTVTMTGTREK